MDESDDAEEYEGKEHKGTSEELANESNGQSFTKGKVTWLSNANRHHNMNKDSHRAQRRGDPGPPGAAIPLR